ncbi:MAG: c-type cytochrome [Pseudomonadota bacterium]
MAQHTPKVDPMSKLVGFISALVLLAAVFYLVNSLINTVGKNTTVGEVVDSPEAKDTETKTAAADTGSSEKQEPASSGGSGGDVAAGEQKYATCAACHGADGKGQGGAFPVLTGIPAGEIEKKLAAYRDGDQDYLKSVGLGDRYGTMAPNASGLSDADIADLAAYIGDAFGGGAGGNGGDSAAAAGGNGGAVDGDIDAGKQAYATCAACHGADGSGQGGAFPVLTEMDASDIQKKLTAYREGDQDYLKSVGLGDRYGTMAPNAANLSDEQIANLSVYIADAFGGTNNGGAAAGGNGNGGGGDAAAKAEPAEPVILDEAVVKHGQALYSNCAVCHGENGQGNELFNAPKLAGTGMDQIASLLKIYRKGQEMGPNSYAMIPQATHLSDEDIDGLAAYIATLEEGAE